MNKQRIYISSLLNSVINTHKKTYNMWVSNNYLPINVYTTEPEQTWHFRHLLNSVKPHERDQVLTWSPRKKAEELTRQYNICVGYTERIAMPAITEIKDNVKPFRVHRVFFEPKDLNDRFLSIRVLGVPPKYVRWIALDLRMPHDSYRLSSSHDIESLPLHPAGLPIIPLSSSYFEFQCHIQTDSNDFPYEVQAEFRLAHLTPERRENEEVMSHGKYPLIEKGLPTGEMIEFSGGIARPHGSSSLCCCCPWLPLSVRASWHSHSFVYS